MRLPPLSLHPSLFTLPTLLLLSLFALHTSLFSSTPISTLDNEPTTLAEHIQSPNTLVLVATQQADLPEIQRLLTLAYSESQAALVLVALPENRFEAATIKNSAKRFFRSAFSKAHVYFIQATDLPYPNDKALLLAPETSKPLYHSKTFPQELPTEKN